MAFIHPHSCECVKSELDLFAVPPTQTSIESGAWLEYNPLSSLTHMLPIEFSVLGSGQEYIDLANTMLYAKVQITRANDANIDNTDHVGPVNLVLQSLFSEVDFKLNDALISSTNNTYAYRAYLETLLSFGPAAKSSQLTASLFYKDTAGHMDETDPTNVNCRNLGLKKRYRYFEDSRVVDMMGPLHCDMFFQDRYLPSDVGFKLRLVRNRDAFCLMSDDAQANYKLKISECKLYVRKVKLSPAVFVAHAKALEVGNAKYPIRRIVCKTFTVPQGNLNFTQENVFSGQLPTRLVIGCVDNAAFNGSYALNPYNFKHYNLTQMNVYLDGQQSHVIKPLELNFEQRQYISGYMTLFAGVEKLHRDEGNDLSRDEYGNGYTLYAFDLTADLNDSNDHFQLTRDGNVRLDVKFSQGLPNTINVVVYAEFENLLEINRNKSVIFDYTN